MEKKQQTQQNKKAEEKPTSKIDKQTPSTSKNQIDSTKTERKERFTTEYQKARKELDGAKYILKKAEEAYKSGVKPTAKQQENLGWAKEAIRRLNTEKMNSLKQLSFEERRKLQSAESSKRQRSVESNERTPKRNRVSEGNPTGSDIKVLDKMPYSEIVKMDLKVCIVDTSNPEWKVNRDNFRKIERFIVKEICKHVVENKVSHGPTYKMDEMLRGHHIITCANVAGVKFLEFVVDKMGQLWEGANLIVKRLHEIPSPPKIFVALPDAEEEEKAEFDNTVMCVLKVQNPQINMKNWKITKKTPLKSSERVLLTIVIDEESQKIIESNDLFINYGVRRCKVRMTSNPNHEEVEKELVDKLSNSLTVEEEEEGMEDALLEETS